MVKKQKTVNLPSASPEEKHGSIHHIVPTSRGGPAATPWNECNWLVKKHKAWHELFYNYLPSTCIAIIRDWTDEQGQLKTEKLGGGNRYLRAWHNLFGNMPPEQAIEFIQDSFMPAELRFLEEIKKASALR